MSKCIDNLTFGEIKELMQLFGGNQAPLQSGKPVIYDGYVGKYVICRSRNEGINAGRVVKLDETGVVLEDARRLYYHKPANKNVSWYEGVAKDGISKDSKIGTPVTKIIAEDYSLTICTDKAEKSLLGAPDHEQS